MKYSRIRDLREVAEVINKSQQGYSHIEDGKAEVLTSAQLLYMEN